VPTPPVTLVFESTLACSRAALWRWITDLRCLRREMMPFLRMTAPAGVHRLTELPRVPGRPLFRSLLLALGVVPIDCSWLTLTALDEQQGFHEQSPMLSMRRWSHRRQILDHPTQPGRLLLRDTLEFEPRWRFMRALLAWFVRRFFEHRHAVLRRAFCGGR